MKLYDLDVGDKFKLAGDESSPIFEVHHYWVDSNKIACLDTDLQEHIFPGYVAVIYIRGK